MSPALFACTIGTALAAAPVLAQPLGTAFTYQGQLTQADVPATGLYDLQVCLFDAPTNPTPLACAPDFADVPVEAGVFTIALDFGPAAFVGQQRFLELRVRPGASTGAYTSLAPRQPIRAAPESLRANVASAAPWSGLSGVPTGFADGIDNDSGGSVTSITAGTGLSGGTITGSGTLAIANGGVGSAQIADGGVTTVDIAADSIGSAQIATNGVAAAELADQSVDTAAIQNLAVSQAKIAPGAVGPGQLAAGAVGLAQINAGQVQARVAGTCAVGEYFRGINADGSVACEPVPGVPRISIVDDPTNTLAFGAAIAIGVDGLPVVAYHDTTAGALKVARCANSACTGAATITTVDDTPNFVGGDTAIAIGADGLPVISYRDSSAGTLKVAKCANAACTGTATVTTVDPSANDVGFFTAIAIGSDGAPVISYWDQTAFALKVAKCANPACTGVAIITTVDDPPGGDVGRDTAIAIGTDGLPVISYHDFNGGALKVARCINAACTGGATITFVDDPPGNNVGAFSSIAIGTDGFPVISYRDLTAGALKIAKCASPACVGGVTITTVDDPPVNAVGFFSAIAVGADGLPVVSHLDNTAQALKIARCTNAACTAATLSTVDDPINPVGQDTSIAIGADGLPVIAYFDITANALKVAKCGTRSCQ